MFGSQISPCNDDEIWNDPKFVSLFFMDKKKKKFYKKRQKIVIMQMEEWMILF